MKSPIVVWLALCLLGRAEAEQVLLNGDFEGGATNGVPEGWTRAASTTYVSPLGPSVNWQLFSTSLNRYPPLDVYAGTASLGVYRTDGTRATPVGQGLDFYYFDVLYQTIPVRPSTRYYVRASAAAFVHHNRMDDLDDFWGAGVALRICPGAGVFDDAHAVWQHNFWNCEGDSVWRYGAELRNQLSDSGGNPLPNSFTTTATQTNITFNLLWMTKWDAYMDLAAVDSIQLDLSTNGPAPPGSDEFAAKDPATWTQADPTWNPVERLIDWAKPGAVNGGDQFRAPQELTVGLYPVCAATGDLNGDGLPDLAVASMKGHLISVFLQRPGGGFQAGTHLPGAIAPKCVQIGPVLGGPALDLIASSAGRHEVLIYPGNGDGTFGAPDHVNVPTTKQLGWIALGDFDNDSHMDFAVTAMQPGSAGDVFIFRGEGAGNFTLKQTLRNVSSPYIIMAADFGGRGTPPRPDGKLDLAFLTWDGEVYSYLGNGDGTFALAQYLDSGGAWKSTGMTIANLDEDTNSLLDICVTYMWGPGDSADHAQLLTGLGNGRFTPQARWEDWLSVSRFPSGVDALDFYQDGHIDLAFSNFGSPDGVVFRNRGWAGRYNFAEALRFGVGYRNSSLIARDLNGDGHPDLVVTAAGCQTVNVIYGGPGGTVRAPTFRGLIWGDSAAVADFVKSSSRQDVATGSDWMRVFRNDGQMSFTQIYGYNMTGNCTVIKSADMNGDGNQDIVALRAPANGAATTIVCFLGNGAANFTVTSYPATGARQTRDLVLADWDNSGSRDVAVSEAQTNLEGIYTLLNNGAGVLGSPRRTALPAGSGPEDLAAGEFNGDAFPDVVVALSMRNQFAFLAGRGDGFFDSPVTFATGSRPIGICAADFNGDGKLDVAVANRGDETVMVFLGDGTGGFTNAGVVAVGSAPTHLMAHDFNGDGLIDLVVSCPGDKTICYLRGKGDGTFHPAQNYRTTSPPARVTAGDLLGTGLPDLIVGPDCEIFQNALLGVGATSLSASLSGNNVVLSWPVPATDCVLEKATALGPGAVWVPLAMPPVNDHGTNRLIESPTNGLAFYRLRHSSGLFPLVSARGPNGYEKTPASHRN